MRDKDLQYLRIAVANSKESFEKGRFPARAIVVKDDKVIALEVRVPYQGLRRIVYAIPKSKVSGIYYETHAPTQRLIDSSNEQIERVHIAELEQEALQIVKTREKKYL